MNMHEIREQVADIAAANGQELVSVVERITETNLATGECKRATKFVFSGGSVDTGLSMDELERAADPLAAVRAYFAPPAPVAAPVEAAPVDASGAPAEPATVVAPADPGVVTQN